MLSPGQRTGRQEREENTQRENAPSGGHKEAKTEPQEENVNLNETFNPSVKNKPIEPTASPEQGTLNALEENLCFFNNHVEMTRRAHNETTDRGSKADPVKAALRRTQLNQALRACEAAEASWDRFAQSLQEMRTPKSPLQESANFNRPQGQDPP